MHIAQMNVGTALYDLTDPRMAYFMDNLDRVNALAEASPGFVWRLTGEGNNATDIKPPDDPRFIVNMSVWESVEALFDYVYRSDHRGVMVQRREWFAKPEGPYQVLWWVEEGALADGRGGARAARVISPSTVRRRPPSPSRRCFPAERRRAARPQARTLLRRLGVEAGCGRSASSAGRTPARRTRYAEAARSVGRAIARRGLTLVYGGAAVGLMGALADAALRAGGERDRRDPARRWSSARLRIRG